MFSFGIEHEVAFLNERGQFADFSRTSFEAFDRIVEQLPLYPNDCAHLRIGDAGIRKKRWYIEGFERFSEEGKVIDCQPKGIEIRTTIHTSIQGAIAELSESFALLARIAQKQGFTPVLTSFNPDFANYEPQPPLNRYEQQRMQASPEEQTGRIPMVTYGPDLNLSLAGMTAEELVAMGDKLTFYSPYIIPFSFSSPFYQGQLWRGLSVRTYLRTGPRPAAQVFLARAEDRPENAPFWLKVAQIPAEVGRIEFKAFDSCDDFQLYAALFALLKGIVRDRTLSGRARIPDRALHQRSALEGFESDRIYSGAVEVLQAAEQALARDADFALLKPLRSLLERRRTPAHRFIEIYQQSGSIISTLKQTYPEQNVLSSSQ